MQLGADVSLRSIEFKSSGGPISSVRCTLTNGVSSLLFEKAGAGDKNPVTYNFDTNKKIRKVEASSNGSHEYVAQLKFFDSANAELFSYNPSGYTNPTVAHEIGDNEELIGFYGVKDI